MADDATLAALLMGGGDDVTTGDVAKRMDRNHRMSIRRPVTTLRGSIIEDRVPIPERDYAADVKAIGASAADPLGVPSALVGMYSPDARKAWRDTYEGNPGASAVGAILGMPPALKAGEAIAAGVRNAPKLATMLAGGVGATASPSEAGDRTHIPTAQAEIKSLQDRLAGIDTQILANGKDKKLSPARTTEINAGLEAEKGRLQGRLAELNTGIAAEQKRVEMEQAPFRERHPWVSTAATLGAMPLAGFLAKQGADHVAKGIRGAVDAATTAGKEARAVDFVRGVETAGRLTNTAPGKAAAIGAATAPLPAEVQMAGDLADYKLMPHDSRAYKEAEKKYGDPWDYAKAQAIPLAGGVVSTATGLKMSDLLRGTARAEARSLQGSLNGVKGATTEELAAGWAKNAGEAANAETTLAGQLARSQQAQQDVRRMRQLHDAELQPGSSPVAGQPGQSQPTLAGQLAASPQQGQLPAPQSASGTSQALPPPEHQYWATQNRAKNGTFAKGFKGKKQP